MLSALKPYDQLDRFILVAVAVSWPYHLLILSDDDTYIFVVSFDHYFLLQMIFIFDLFSF